MDKYNITEQKAKRAAGRLNLCDQSQQDLRDKIVERLFLGHKYRESGYSAARLAAELGTKPRYISGVMNTYFHASYPQYVARLRVDEAIRLLTDPRYNKYTVEEIGYMAGFPNRQRMYSAFNRYCHTTPNALRFASPVDK